MEDKEKQDKKNEKLLDKNWMDDSNANVTSEWTNLNSIKKSSFNSELKRIAIPNSDFPLKLSSS